MDTTMTDLTAITNLLTEIRDLQKVNAEAMDRQADLAREEVARSIANQEKSLANQEIAIRSQRATARLYRVVVAVAGIALVIGVVTILSAI
jgi:t-SNARE complex subunit (syntaxin)